MNERSSYYQRTAQEITGDPWFADQEMKAGRFNVPIGIFRHQISISELNEERSRIGFVEAFTAKVMLMNNDVVFSLEPLDPETGETVRRPQILLLDRESQELRAVQELTEQYYLLMREWFEREKGDFSPLELALYKSYFSDDLRSGEVENTNEYE